MQTHRIYHLCTVSRIPVPSAGHAICGKARVLSACLQSMTCVCICRVISMQHHSSGVTGMQNKFGLGDKCMDYKEDCGAALYCSNQEALCPEKGHSSALHCCNRSAFAMDSKLTPSQHTLEHLQKLHILWLPPTKLPFDMFCCSLSASFPQSFY